MDRISQDLKPCVCSGITRTETQLEDLNHPLKSAADFIYFLIPDI